MDKYWYSDTENMLVNNAVAFAYQDCVEAAGSTMRPWGGDSKSLQDFQFGQWSRPLAAKNGTAPETRTIPGVHEMGDHKVSSADDLALKKCTTSIGRAGFPELLEGLAGDESVQIRIVQDAGALMKRDPEYLAYRKAWEDCVADKGMKLSEEGSWILSTGGSREDEIRVALLDVECKESSGGARKPYDIFAQYQAVLLEEHQATLNVLAEKKAAAVERARQVLREHGVADAKL